MYQVQQLFICEISMDWRFLPKVLMTADIIVIAELQVQPVFINSGVGDDLREPRFEGFDVSYLSMWVNTFKKPSFSTSPASDSFSAYLRQMPIP